VVVGVSVQAASIRKRVPPKIDENFRICTLLAYSSSGRAARQQFNNHRADLVG
jgi:hypothetical protein